MRQTWIRPIEQIVLPALEGKLRILGFTSPGHGAGVTSICQAAAETIARSGVKVLLLDLTQASEATGRVPGWVPGLSAAREQAHRHESGFDILTAQPSPETRFLFNDGKRLRLALAAELADYAVVIVDLPPLLDASAEIVNPVAAALACDQVLLVCANALTRRPEARSAVALARASGIKLSGTVFNDLGRPGLVEEIATSLAHWTRFWPALSIRLDRLIRTNPILN